MKQILAIFLGLMVAGNAIAADWKQIGEYSNRKFYVEREGIKKSTFQGKPIVGTWVRVDINSNEKEKMFEGKYIRSENMFFWYNCADETVSDAGEFIQYDINGNVLRNLNLPNFNKKFTNILPDTTEKKAYDVVCINAFMRDFSSLGKKPTQVQINDLATQYPLQMHDYLEYIKNNLK